MRWPVPASRWPVPPSRAGPDPRARISRLGLGDRPHGVPSDEHRVDGASLRAGPIRAPPSTPPSTPEPRVRSAARPVLGAHASHGPAMRRSAWIVARAAPRSGTLQSYDYTVSRNRPIAAQRGGSDRPPLRSAAAPIDRPLRSAGRGAWMSRPAPLWLSDPSRRASSQNETVRTASHALPSSAAYGCIDAHRASAAR